MPFRIVGFLVATLVASASISAEEQSGIFCPASLSDYYEMSTMFSDAPKLVLKPELGSVEEERPGTVSNLMRLRNEFLSEKTELWNHGPPSPAQVRHLIERFSQRLQSIKIRVPEVRFSKMVDAAVEHVLLLRRKIARRDHLRVMNAVLAIQWELTVACFFDGEKIFLGNTVGSLFPHEFERSRESDPSNNWEREIDIAIQGWDGNWRWIEVKDWATDALKSVWASRFENQGRGQKEARLLLPQHEIEMTLLFKYALGSAERAHVLSSGYYDNMLFVFPEQMVRSAKLDSSLSR